MEGFPNVWEVCKFADEITTGALDESKFAVELYSILDKSADDVYKNPQIFLRNTYLTGNMKGILKSVLLKLARNEGSPVYILDTEFGGGKTHTLLLLYHIFSNRDLGSNYIREYDIDKETGVLEVPDVEVVAIDCRNIKRKTLWGEIAYLLNSYESVRQEDENIEPIQQIDVIKQWFVRKDSLSSPSSSGNKRVLLLIDELPHYLLDADSKKIGEVTLEDLTISFIQKLVSAVSSVQNCVLVITLTGRQSLYKKYSDNAASAIEKTMDSLRQSVSRQSTTTIPISKEDIYSVIVKRLVKKIDNRTLVNDLIKEYAEYYKRHLITDDPNYKDKLEKAYPFHPFFIDTLYDRVSTIESFNKTRGMLRFLATILHNIYRNRRDVKLVSADSIDLQDNRIKDSITTLRNGLRQVIESDCINHAKELDSRKNIKIVESIAKTVLLYSLIQASRESGIKIRELKLAVCRPGMDDSIVDEAIKEIEENFWHIKKTTNEEYLLIVQPNINKIIYEFTQNVKDSDVNDEIRGIIKQVIKAGSGFKVIYGWESNADDDRAQLRIVVIDHEDIEKWYNQNDKDSIKRMLNDMLEYTATGDIREYKNTLLFLYPHINGINVMKSFAKRLIACKEIKNRDILKDKEDIKVIDKKLSEAQNNLSSAIKSAYTNIAFPSFYDIKTAQIETIKNTSIVEGIENKLLEEDKLLKENDTLDPHSIEEMLPSDRPYIKVEDIWEHFMKNRSKPFVSTVDVIRKGVSKGVKEGHFGYANELNEKDGKYIAAEIGKDVQVQLAGYIIRKEYIEMERGRGLAEQNKEEDLIKGSTSIDGGYSGYQEPSFLYKRYRHILSSRSIEECIKLLPKLLLIRSDNIKEKYIDIELKRDKNRITIHDELKDIHELKSLLQLLKDKKYQGSGKLILIADKDITDELKGEGLNDYLTSI